MSAESPDPTPSRPQGGDGAIGEHGLGGHVRQGTHPTSRGVGTVGSAGLTVGATAEAVGVSVRTLHHWDEIGLVTPGHRTYAGYRLYSRADIARIQQVLVYREVGMPLAEVARVLDAPGASEAKHLARQRRLLTDRIARLQEMVSAVDHLMEVGEMNEQMTPQEQAEAFGTEWSDPYAQEAEERWGNTDEWAQSQAVKARMTPADWAQAKEDLEELEAALAAGLRNGVEPGSSEANELAERHLANISQWMDTSHSKHVLIATNYTEDPRFAKHYDDREPGLAVWLRAIIDANARANGVDPEKAEWK